MISRQDILDRAAEWGLRPDVVEKDYVLGWMLSALAKHPETSEKWVFKGGTCLKKCYYETYRFSEDLDFSLTPDAAYSREELEAILRDLTAGCARESGIEFLDDRVIVRERTDRLEGLTFEGRIGYRGPLAIPSWPRVKFDLTQHELIARRPTPRAIIHPYPDDLPVGAPILSYAFEELIAEKTRALIERVRPRDLYDVVFLLDNAVELPDPRDLRAVFHEKCRWKGIEPPTAQSVVELVGSSEELKADWEAMLRHQLPELPPLETIRSRLVGLLEWLDGLAVTPRGGLSPAPGASGELVVARGIEFTGSGGAIETLRFAGANRLVVEFTYHGKQRLVEPYSLRRPATGNLLLSGWEHEAGHMKSFKVLEMDALCATRTPFVPRYAVELSAHGPIPVQTPSRSTTRRQGRRTPTGSSGRRYVVECSHCGKRFYRKRSGTSIRKHKSKEGWECAGRRGYLVDVR